EQLVDYTVADSNEVSLSRRFYPNIRVAFDLTKPEPFAWAFAKTDDESLLDEARAYFKELTDSGELEQLLDRFYGHIEHVAPTATRTFLRHIPQRMEQYREAFIKAGEETGIDWRLLAAVAYQESRWNKDAVSPTGVRGLMMLTQSTAKMMKIKDRRDPFQSIDGGARYLKRVIGKIPERIQEPDRTWFALASYNVGFGHLEDARKLAQGAGANPDRWHVVKRYLPLLSQRKWYTKTRYGYARGKEPVTYVQRIRRYYDLLVWYDTEEAEGYLEEVNPVFPEINTPTL
ncbi:MAG: membrane-bound lytic murein transglycosylase MltF, partial [Gammaproteobacteria bacterium]